MWVPCLTPGQSRAHCDLWAAYSPFGFLNVFSMRPVAHSAHITVLKSSTAPPLSSCAIFQPTLGWTLTFLLIKHLQHDMKKHKFLEKRKAIYVLSKKTILEFAGITSAPPCLLVWIKCITGSNCRNMNFMPSMGFIKISLLRRKTKRKQWSGKIVLRQYSKSKLSACQQDFDGFFYLGMSTDLW